VVSKQVHTGITPATTPALTTSRLCSHHCLPLLSALPAPALSTSSASALTTSCLCSHYFLPPLLLSVYLCISQYNVYLNICVYATMMKYKLRVYIKLLFLSFLGGGPKLLPIYYSYIGPNVTICSLCPKKRVPFSPFASISTCLKNSIN